MYGERGRGRHGDEVLLRFEGVFSFCFGSSWDDDVISGCDVIDRNCGKHMRTCLGNILGEEVRIFIPLHSRDIHSKWSAMLKIKMRPRFYGTKSYSGNN